MSSKKNPEIDEQLIKIWLEARKLRNWIAQERRKILLEKNKMETENLENQIDNNTDDLASYESLSNEIIHKMNFLLHIAPIMENENENDIYMEIESINQSGDSNKTKKRSYSPVLLRTSLEDPIVESWREMFERWRTAQKLTTSQRTKRKQQIMSEQFTSIPQLIHLFIKETDINKFQKFMEQRKERAQRKIYLFNTIHNMLKTIRLTSVLNGIF